MAWIRDFTATDVVTASTNPAAQVQYPTHETNDVLLLYMACDATNIPSLPSGYTDIQNQAGAAQTFRLCYKIAASSAEVCPTLTLSAADEWHITVIAVAGADYADPINFSGERTATDSAAPFTWTSGLSTDENNVLIFHFCNSDSGLALTALPPFVNLVNGDCGSAGGSCAYTFQPTSGSITDCSWTGRANDDTTACVVGINDDGNSTRPAYAGSSTAGTYISALGGTSLIESDTNPASLTFGAIGQRDFSKVWTYDGAAYTDETTDMTSAATADVPMTNATNAALYLGFGSMFGSAVVQVSTAQSGANYVWEYYNGSWTTLTVTGVLTATGWQRLYWTIPSDWTKVSVNGTSNYYVRFRQTGLITTPPVFSMGLCGGRLTTYDAIGNIADAGVNPYNDGISLSPAQTANLSGSERLFGSAKDMDTGVLVLHHKAVAARDYAVDPAVNDQTYPVTEIATGGRAGYIVVLADADGDYEAYSIHGKGALSASNNDYNVAAIGLNDSAEAWGIHLSLNKSAVTRMLFLPQGENGAMLSYVSTLLIVSKIVVVGGSGTMMADADDLKWVVNHAMGVSLLFSGIGLYNRVYAPIQIGGDALTCISVDGQTYAMPTTYDGKKYFDWNAANNVAGWQFYGTSLTDKIYFTNCVFIGSQPYRWEFNASHNVNASIDFRGTKVQGATVTLRSTVYLDEVTFASCPTFTLNGATLGDCSFVNTKISASSPGDVSGVSNCSFTKKSGTQHAIEISGTAADFDLTGCTFTGYATSDGSTGNECIYVNIATGSMTISVKGGGDIPSIRTAGATVKVVNARTVSVTARDANSLALIDGARVGLWAYTGTTVTITRLVSTAIVSHSTHGYITGQKVCILGAEQGEYNGIKTITYIDANSYSYTVSGTPATPATGTIKSHRVILDGTTSSGVLQDTNFNYTADLAVTGRVRKAPGYKTAPLSGNITTSGYAATVYMVGD